MIHRIGLLVVVAASIFVTLPQLIRTVRRALDLAPFSLETRRQQYVPGYSEPIWLKQKLGLRQPIAFIAERSRDVDTMLFINYYLYPRVTRRFVTPFQYAVVPVENRPRALVAFDPLRVTTYPALRAEKFAGRPLVSDFGALTTATSFIVPLVASLDGPQPHTYTTEAIIENRGRRHAAVRIDLRPTAMVKILTIAPGQSLRFVDIVYELFGRLDRGWLRVSATAPVAAAFSLVNRGTEEIDAIPIVTGTEGLILRADQQTGARLWTIDLIGGGFHEQPLGEALDRRLGPNEYAFVSFRRADQSEVIWPTRP